MSTVAPDTPQGQAWLEQKNEHVNAIICRMIWVVTSSNTLTMVRVTIYRNLGGIHICSL